MVEAYSFSYDVETGFTPGLRATALARRDLVEEMLNRGKNPLIYEYTEVENPQKEGHLNIGWTKIYPGKVGDEYYMTRGHFHKVEASGEVYIGLRGEGIVLTQTRDGKCVHAEIAEGKIVYVPPGVAHRTVNTGDKPLIFLYIYPSYSGHDYGTIAELGFARVDVAAEDRHRPWRAGHRGSTNRYGPFPWHRRT